MTLWRTGRSQEAIENIEKAMRLSPHDPLMFMFLSITAFAHFTAERYEEALDWAKRSLRRRPDYPLTHCVLAATYARLDRIDEARTAAEELLRRLPEFSLGGLKLFFSGVDPGFLDRYFDGLHKAGLKE